MKKIFFALLLCALGFLIADVTASAQEKKPAAPPKSAVPPTPVQPSPAQAPVVDRRKLPLAQRPNLSLADVNADLGVDKRVIVMMAALNVAGYDYESGGRQLSPLRRQVREDLKEINPDLTRRLKNYLQAHRKGASDYAAVAPYLSLALCLTDPPAFTIDVAAERLPDDVREITDFALLLEEFYRTTGFGRLLPKYVAEYLKVAQTYPGAMGLALGTVLSYLHTEPVLELPPLYTLRPSNQKRKKDEPPETKIELPNRVRQFVVVPDLLNSTGAANLRIVRDTYFLLLGPTTEPNIEAMRRAFIAFVLDPLTEKKVKEVAAIRGDLKKLMESRGARLDQEYASRSAYYLITDSLVRATDARMDVVGAATRRRLSEDEALYELSLGYDRGAVLVFHFYDQMKAYEAVGVNVRDYYGDLLKGIDFDRESKRLDEYAQRLARVKQLRTEATLAPAPKLAGADEQLTARIAAADGMIRARRYDEARAVLEAARKEQPNNARVLYGLAEVTSKQASSVEDADRLVEALYAAVEFYKQAAQQAAPDSERWLAQRSYVAAAKILDFIAENNPSQATQATADATAAYELALKLGKVEGGAYEEAEKAIKQRGERSKQ